MKEKLLSPNELLRTEDGETFEVWRKAMVLRRSEIPVLIDNIITAQSEKQAAIESAIRSIPVKGGLVRQVESEPVEAPAFVASLDDKANEAAKSELEGWQAIIEEFSAE